MNFLTKSDYIVLGTDKNGAALFAIRSAFPDPAEPQEVYLAVGSIEEHPDLARPVLGRIDKAAAVQIVDGLLALIENDMVTSTAQVVPWRREIREVS